MATTRVSSKYQVVIPKEVRERMALAVGTVLEVVAVGGLIALVPREPLEELRGIARGADRAGYRDEEERL